jgi:hypothetical protein
MDWPPANWPPADTLEWCQKREGLYELDRRGLRPDISSEVLRGYSELNCEELIVDLPDPVPPVPDPPMVPSASRQRRQVQAPQEVVDVPPAAPVSRQRRQVQAPEEVVSDPPVVESGGAASVPPAPPVSRQRRQVQAPERSSGAARFAPAAAGAGSGRGG